jgi:hypothetical protein
MGMLAFLMVTHIGLMWVGISQCDEYAAIFFESVRKAHEIGQPIPSLPVIEECTDVEDEYTRVAAQYISLILALIGGAATGVAIGKMGPK